MWEKTVYLKEVIKMNSEQRSKLVLSQRAARARGIQMVQFEDLFADYNQYPVRGEDGVNRRRSREDLVRDMGRVGMSITAHP